VSWKDRLQVASLGGVSFLAQTSRFTVGRRNVVIELPNREQPEHEDMGRRARRCSLTAFIVGDDYDLDRAALVAVLESRGPHKFVHPWWGESLVIVEDPGEFEETVERGRGVSVSLTLVEAGAQTKVTATVLPSAVMATAITAAIDAAAADFVDKYAVGLGDSFAQAAAAIGEVNDEIDKVNNKIAAAMGIADGVLAAMDEAKELATELIGSPADLFDTLKGLLSAVTGLLGLTDGIDEEFPGQANKIATDTAQAAAQQHGAVDVTAEPPYPGGPIEPTTEASTKAVGKAVRTLSLVGVADRFRTLAPESGAAATEALDVLGGLVEQLLADETTSDDLAAALTDLRAATQQQLGALVGSLPTTTTYTPPGSVPALLLAWQLHGDPTRDLEIVARNGVLDPNFVPGGAPLEILNA
jgi:prophage DNA circulation protein